MAYRRGTEPVVDEAREFLEKTRPKTGEVPADEIRDYVAANLPFSFRSVVKAKKALGIRSVQKAHRWYWVWP